MTQDYQDHIEKPREDARENDEDDEEVTDDDLEAALAALHMSNLGYIEAVQKVTDTTASLIATVKKQYGING